MIDKDKIKQIIRDELKNMAFVLLKNKNAKKDISKKKETKEEKAIRHDIVDKVLFYGLGNEDEINASKQRYLKEQDEKEGIVVTRDDVDNFEKEFKENVSRLTTFDKQDNKGNSLYLYNGSGGIEALASGTIQLPDNDEIEWSYSLKDGIKINTDGELNKDMLNVLNKLSSYYVSWSAKWTEMLTQSK